MQNNPHAVASSNQSWLIGAPLTKILAAVTGISYAIIEARKSHDTYAFDTNAILQQGQVYRLFTGPITFRSSGEIIVGLCVLVNLSRRFEREMGTRKFCIWLIGVGIISSIMELLVVGQLLGPVQYSGPYHTIGSLVWMFHTTAPRLHPRFFGMFGLHFSEKSIAYVFYSQMILICGLDSLIPCVCGMIVAQMVKTIPPLHHALDVPDALASTVTTTIQRFIEDPPAPLVQTTRQQRHRVPAPLVPTTLPSPPPESAVQQLTSMGFDRDSVLRALQASQNNVERAADRLLMGG